MSLGKFASKLGTELLLALRDSWNPSFTPNGNVKYAAKSRREIVRANRAFVADFATRGAARDLNHVPPKLTRVVFAGGRSGSDVRPVLEFSIEKHVVDGIDTVLANELMFKANAAGVAGGRHLNESVGFALREFLLIFGAQIWKEVPRLQGFFTRKQDRDHRQRLGRGSDGVGDQDHSRGGHCAGNTHFWGGDAEA